MEMDRYALVINLKKENKKDEKRKLVIEKAKLDMMGMLSSGSSGFSPLM